jgi:two-component system, OmpR family, sensor histidine kinase MprB
MLGFHRRRRAPLRPASSLSLRWRVMLLAMSMVAMVVVLMAFAVYAVVSAALYGDIDNQLQSRAQLLIQSGSLAADPGKAIEGTAYSDVNAMLVNPGDHTVYKAQQPGETLPVGSQEKAVIRGELFLSRRTASDQRILAIHLPNGSSLLISKSLKPTQAVMNQLQRVLLLVGGIGVAVAAVAGGMVTRAGLRPVGRLTEAAERVARTNDLRPIPVFGSDELARLTEAFNLMLRALAESRERQARLVTDAGHELRTPLTSLRTNVELLMASMEPGAPRLPEQEMVDLRADVLAQIEELSTLVGDLVDLTRDDAGQVVHEPVDMSEVIDRSLERVRRRRNDIQFDVEVIPWQVYGDAAGLSRAALNLMDNAAKWSPPGGHVGVRMRQLDPSHAELVVSDHGPGIPPHERRLVFERFYRSMTARALPGSGLGLAMVKQVVLNHGGLLRVEDTVPGGQPPGTSIYVLLPGRPMPKPAYSTAGADDTGDIESEANTDPGVPAAGNAANSRDSANVISVDSQSARAR